LPARYTALNLAKPFAESRTDNRSRAAEREIQRAHRLKFTARTDTVSAEYAFARVTGNRIGSVVTRRVARHLLETHIVYTELRCNFLELAIPALRASCALLVVARQHKLNNHFTHIADLRRVGMNYHTVCRFCGTSRQNPAPVSVFHFNYAHTARAEYADIRVIAECRQFNPRFAAKLNQIDFTLERHFYTVYNYFHFFFPPIPLQSPQTYSLVSKRRT
jgi:hypothetical protein